MKIIREVKIPLPVMHSNSLFICQLSPSYLQEDIPFTRTTSTIIICTNNIVRPQHSRHRLDYGNLNSLNYVSDNQYN